MGIIQGRSRGRVALGSVVLFLFSFLTGINPAQAVTGQCLTAEVSLNSGSVPAGGSAPAQIDISVAIVNSQACQDFYNNYSYYRLRAGINGPNQNVIDGTSINGRYNISLAAPLTAGTYPIVIKLYACDDYGTCDVVDRLEPTTIRVTNYTSVPSVGIVASTAKVYQFRSGSLTGTAYKSAPGGSRSYGTFDGTVILQFRRPGGTYSQIQSRNGYGSRTVRFSIKPNRSGYYRIKNAENGSVSTSKYVAYVPATSRYRVSTANVVGEPAIKGTSHQIKARITVRYSDGKWAAVPEGTSFKVQRKDSGSSSWRTIRTDTTSTDGQALSYVTITRTGSFRIAKGSFTSSADAVRVIPRKPSKIKAYWPSTVYGYSNFYVDADLRANDGTCWNSKVKVTLQTRRSKYDDWQNLDYVNTRGCSTEYLVGYFYSGVTYYRIIAKGFKSATQTYYPSA